MGHEFCRVCGLSLGTSFEPSSFEGDDEPTALQPPEFARRAARQDARPRVVAARPRVTRAPAPAPAPAVGFRTGLLLGAGATGLVFGSIALVGIGYVVGTRNAGNASLATITEPALAAPRIAPVASAPVVAAPAPIVEQRLAQPAAFVAHEVEPVTPGRVVAEPVVAVAPREEPKVEAKAVEVAVETKRVEPKIVAKPEPRKAEPKKVEPKVEPKAEPKKAEPKVVAKPEPKAVAKVEPKAAPAPVARPSRDELAALAATARQKAAPAVATKPAPQPAAKAAPAYNWEEHAAPAPAPAAAAWSFDDAPAAEPAPAAAPAASTPDPELEDILGSGPASAPAPVKVAAAPARTPSARVIRARKGAVTIPLNANIALTRANGTPLVGKLVAVEGGFIDVKTSSAQLRIAEADVIEAATY